MRIRRQLDFRHDHVGGCATPYLQEQDRLQFQIELFIEYGHLMAPWLARTGLSLNQFNLLWAAGYRGTRTVANLAYFARIDTDAALEDLKALEREGYVALEEPPPQFLTPLVERTDRYDEIRIAMAPIVRRLEYPLRGDPSYTWQSARPRV